MQTPLLFTVFNRPDTTRKVFEVVKKLQPKTLFIAADGPRTNIVGEKERCEQVRGIVEQIDWDCDVKTLFREKNLGCGKAMHEAITWFFEHVEEGIILEDDCLPDVSFFPFCEELLARYRYDESVFMISGANFLPKSLQPVESYYFSQLPHVWGWATWRRSWEKYDFAMKDFASFKKEEVIKHIWKDKNIQRYFLDWFKEVYSGRLDTWDYQVNYCIWKNKGVSITPSVNLISNIGFRPDATHTVEKNILLADLPLEEMRFPLVHPTFNVYEQGDTYENKKISFSRILLWRKFFNSIGLLRPARYIYRTFFRH